MDSNSIRELNLEEMNKVSGGVQKTVVTGSAMVRSGPGTNYPPSRKLGYNTVVNFTGTVLYNEQEGRRWNDSDMHIGERDIPEGAYLPHCWREWQLAQKWHQQGKRTRPGHRGEEHCHSCQGRPGHLQCGEGLCEWL